MRCVAIQLLNEQSLQVLTDLANCCPSKLFFHSAFTSFRNAMADEFAWPTIAINKMRVSNSLRISRRFSYFLVVQFTNEIMRSNGITPERPPGSDSDNIDEGNPFGVVWSIKILVVHNLNC